MSSHLYQRRWVREEIRAGTLVRFKVIPIADEEGVPAEYLLIEFNDRVFGRPKTTLLSLGTFKVDTYSHERRRAVVSR